MEKLLAWKIMPRLMMLVMTIMYIRVIEWGMSLEDLSTQQSAMISDFLLGILHIDFTKVYFARTIGKRRPNDARRRKKQIADGGKHLSHLASLYQPDSKLSDT